MKDAVSFAVAGFFLITIIVVTTISGPGRSPAVQIACLVCLTLAFLAYCGLIGYQEMEAAKRARAAENRQAQLANTPSPAQPQIALDWTNDLQNHKDLFRKELKVLEERLTKAPPDRILALTNLLKTLQTTSPTPGDKPNRVKPISAKVLKQLIAFVDTKKT